MKLNVVVPSRGRPDNIARLAQGIHDTTNSRVTTLTVVVDHDDPRLQDYVHLAGQHQWWDLMVQTDYRKLGPILNAYAVPLAQHYTHIAFMGDDHLPRSPLWDEILINALAGRPGVAYGNDLLQGQNLPTAVVISSDLIRALGYMQPRELVHLYFDDFWKVLGTGVGNLAYRGDVVIEHVHPAAGKTAWTPEYAWTCSPQLMTEDGERFSRYMHEQWPGELARLKKELGLG